MIMNCEKVVGYLRGELNNYIKTNNLKSLVLGVSGGADSALIAALVKPVCDELCIPLIGRSIPIQSNKLDEIQRANMICNAFCSDYKVVDLTHAYMNMINDGMDEVNATHVLDTHNDKIRRGNIKARIRMIYLYNLASAHGGLVLSTDNLTELMVGFWTLHGDVGDYGLIQKYWKTEVYELMSYLVTTYGPHSIKGTERAEALLACINAVPTDGLGITSSDLEQLGASTYAEVDKILKTWLTFDSDSFTWDDHLKYDDRKENYDEFVEYRQTLANHPVIQRYRASMFKRENPLNVERMIEKE
jgi:NAD+ synthase